MFQWNIKFLPSTCSCNNLDKLFHDLSDNKSQPSGVMQNLRCQSATYCRKSGRSTLDQSINAFLQFSRAAAAAAVRTYQKKHQNRSFRVRGTNVSTATAAAASTLSSDDDGHVQMPSLSSKPSYASGKEAGGDLQ